jgi:hypothetical protein
MHRGLEIAEIVNLIVSELDPQEQAKELASLAQTCTIFHDVALDGLWSHQEHIFNLLHCMPTDLWETKMVNFVRTLVRDAVSFLCWTYHRARHPAGHL